MKSFILIVLIALIGFVFCSEEKTFERQLLEMMMPKILLEEYNNVPREDGYNFSYKTTDGTIREETGIIMNPGTPEQEIVVMGSFGYQDDKIKTVTMYTADKKGYRPRVTLKNRKLNPKLLASLAG